MQPPNFRALTCWTRHVGGIDYQATKELTFDVGRKGSGWRVTVPVGFYFQVSVPWYLRWLVNPHNEAYHKAAALHDVMLEEGNDRKTSGAVFYDVLRFDGAGYYEAHILWFIVSVFRENK